MEIIILTLMGGCTYDQLNRNNFQQTNTCFTLSSNCSLILHLGLSVGSQTKYLSAGKRYRLNFTPTQLILDEETTVIIDKSREDTPPPKNNFGFGAYLIQKYPTNSKVFKNRSFGNVWEENSLSVSKRNHPHQKPKGLIKALIEAATEKGDLIVDPCAGS